VYPHHLLIHDPKIFDNIFGISVNLLGVLATCISTLILGGLAIFGEQVKKIFLKPKIMGVESKRTFQQVGNREYIYNRLIVENIGRVSAKDVRALLTYFDGPKAENFIPFPLNWTHWNRTTRDISRGEPAYIDILFKLREDPGPYRFCYSQETGTPYERDLTHFDTRKGNLRIEFYERDSKIGDVILLYLEKEDELAIAQKKDTSSCHAAQPA
jgi:hypothetical protein